MNTCTIEFDAMEIANLITICNTVIATNKMMLEHIPRESETREKANNAITTIESLKEKIKKAVVDKFQLEV